VLTRRRFLRVGAASLGGIALLGDGAAGGAVPPPLRLCVPTALYAGCSLEHTLEQIARTGVAGVDVWDTGSASPTNPMQWIAAHGPEALAHLVQSLGLRISAFSLFWSSGSALPLRLAWLRDSGGALAVLNGGGALGQPPSSTIRLLEPVVAEAAALGLRVAAANHRGTSLHSAASIRRFVAACRSPALGLALAPHHLAGDDSTADAFAAAGSRLRLVYALDGARDAVDQMHPDTEVCLFTRERMPARQMTRAIASAREQLTTA